MSWAFIGALVGLGVGLLLLPIMTDEFTVFFWLFSGLALGGSLGLVRDILGREKASLERRDGNGVISRS
jgi:hypothetical protein